MLAKFHYFANFRYWFGLLLGIGLGIGLGLGFNMLLTQEHKRIDVAHTHYQNHQSHQNYQNQQKAIEIQALQQQLAELKAQAHLNEALLARYQEQLRATQQSLLTQQQQLALYQHLFPQATTPMSAAQALQAIK